MLKFIRSVSCVVLALQVSLISSAGTGAAEGTEGHRYALLIGVNTYDDVKAIKDDYGCTVNDAIMSICAGAVRRWLIEHDELPDQPLVAQVTFRLSTSSAAHPTWNLVISNVPGPRIPLYCAGARLVANYPVSVITDGMGLNITVMSYLGKLILVRRGMLPYLRGSRRAELHTHDGRRRREGSPTGHRDGRLVGSGHRRSAGGAP